MEYTETISMACKIHRGAYHDIVLLSLVSPKQVKDDARK